MNAVAEMDGALRVLVVEADSRVRRALRALLESRPDVEVVGEARNADEALAQDASLCPAVVLVDLMLPLLPDGLGLLAALAGRARPCVALSWQSGLRELALQLGARRFVEKGASPEVLLAAIWASRGGATATASERSGTGPV